MITKADNKQAYNSQGLGWCALSGCERTDFSGERARTVTLPIHSRRMVASTIVSRQNMPASFGEAASGPLRSAEKTVHLFKMTLANGDKRHAGLAGVVGRRVKANYNKAWAGHSAELPSGDLFSIFEFAISRDVAIVRR